MIQSSKNRQNGNASIAFSSMGLRELYRMRPLIGDSELRNTRGNIYSNADGTCGKAKSFCGKDRFCCLIAWDEQEKICIPKKQDCPDLAPKHTDKRMPGVRGFVDKFGYSAKLKDTGGTDTKGNKDVEKQKRKEKSNPSAPEGKKWFCIFGYRDIGCYGWNYRGKWD